MTLHASEGMQNVFQRLNVETIGSSSRSYDIIVGLFWKTQKKNSIQPFGPAFGRVQRAYMLKFSLVPGKNYDIASGRSGPGTAAFEMSTKKLLTYQKSVLLYK